MSGRRTASVHSIIVLRLWEFKERHLHRRCPIISVIELAFVYECLVTILLLQLQVSHARVHSMAIMSEFCMMFVMFVRFTIQ